MASSNREPPLVPKEFRSVDEIGRGIALLRRRIVNLQEVIRLDIWHSDQHARNAERATARAILEVFGEHSPEYRDDGHVRFIRVWTSSEPKSDTQKRFVQGVRDSITMLEGLIASLEERKHDFSVRRGVAAAGRPQRGTKVFVVHGHDEPALQAVENFLRAGGAEPIILRRQPNQGRTIIEKLEAQTESVSFAVVILTGDDVGCEKPTREWVKGKPPLKFKPLPLKPRARQNVILELGVFLGTLGREHVCALYEHGVEVPSDYAGVAFVPIDGEWRAELGRELVAAGIAFDIAKALGAS